MSLRIPSQQRLVSQHSQTAIFTSLLQSFYFQCIDLVAPNHIVYSCCIHISSWSAGMTNLIILVVLIFLNSLLHFLTCCTIMMSSPYISIIWQEFWWGNMFHPYKPNLIMNFCTGPSFQCHCQCTSTSLLNRISLLCHLLYGTLLLGYFLLNKILITKVTGWSTILIEHVWCF